MRPTNIKIKINRIYRLHRNTMIIHRNVFAQIEMNIMQKKNLVKKIIKVRKKAVVVLLKKRIKNLNFFKSLKKVFEQSSTFFCYVIKVTNHVLFMPQICIIKFKLWKSWL